MTKSDRASLGLDLIRMSIFIRLKALITDIDMLFADAGHWNNITKEEPIGPDPDGKLKRIRCALVEMLQREGISIK